MITAIMAEIAAADLRAANAELEARDQPESASVHTADEDSEQFDVLIPETSSSDSITFIVSDAELFVEKEAGMDAVADCPGAWSRVCRRRRARCKWHHCRRARLNVDRYRREVRRGLYDDGGR